MSISANYEYATACVPGHLALLTYYCTVNIVSKEEANIEINTAEESVSLTLLPGELYQHDIEESQHLIIGVENKAIRIKSDKELQVLVYKDGESREFNDVYMVANQKHANNIYFTSAYTANPGCGSGILKQFYLAASFYNETILDVVQKDGTTYAVDLPEFGTFLQKTNDIDDHLADGTKITSNKAINVVSGNLCMENKAQGIGYIGTYLSNIPGIHSLGQEYVVPRLIHEDTSPPGYSIM